jgi:hypothetical protein
MICISNPSRDKEFFLQNVQTISGVHPGFYSLGAGGCFFPKGLISLGIRLTTHLHLVSRARISGAIPPLSKMPALCGQTAAVFHERGQWMEVIVAVIDIVCLQIHL